MESVVRALLNAKAASTHSHAISDVTGLQAAIDGKQGINSNLTALSGLSLLADRLPYATGVGALALTVMTGFARTLLDDADAATARATLGVPAASSLSTVATSGDYGDLLNSPDLTRYAGISILDHIPNAQHAAIRNFTSTYDCKADIETAIAALSGYGGEIYFPPGRYNTSAAITLTSLNGIHLKGAGRSSGNQGAHLRSTHATGANVLTFSGCYHSGVSGFRFVSSVVPTSGNAVRFTGDCFQSFAKNCRMDGIFNGILIDGATETIIDEIFYRQIYGTYGTKFGGSVTAGYGLTITKVLADNPFPVNADGPVRTWATSTAFTAGDIVSVNGWIYQCNTSGTSNGSGSGPSGFSGGFSANISDGTATWRPVHSASLNWFHFDSNAYSVRMSQCGYINGAQGIYVGDSLNTGTSYPIWLFAFDIEIDHSFDDCMEWAAGEGLFITASWTGSSRRGNGISFSSAFRGEAVVHGTRIMGNGFHGVLIGAGVAISIDGNIIGANSQVTAGSYHGITVGSNISDFSITNNKSGTLNGVNSQGWGIIVNSGTSNDYIIQGNRCQGNITGKVVDGGSGGNKSVTGNI